MSDIIHLLRSLGVKPEKSRGQNFLQSSAALDEIISFMAITSKDSVIEIGPGLGVMTKELLHLAKDVTAIEIQPEFVQFLERRYLNLKVIENSVLNVNFSEFPNKPLVVGNLPYSLSSNILFHILQYSKYISRSVFLLQKEFVERLVADVDTSDYSVLSIMAQVRAEMIPGPVIGGESFFPRAGVQSQVVEIRFLENSEYENEDFDWMHTIVQAAFHQRRKKILNGMLSTNMFSREVLLKALENAGIDPESRPETIEIVRYVRLARGLAKE